MLRRLAIVVLLFSLTACDELDVGCLLLELAVPNQHYDINDQYEGKLTDFQKWWAQFEGTPLGKLLELALEKSPLLDNARKQLAETGYKYGMKEENVEDMMKNLNQYLKISILSPDSMNATDGNLSLTHVITGAIPKDFQQDNKNYLRLFKFTFEVDLFGKNKMWRKSAINDIMSVVEIVKDTFSLIRLRIAKNFVYIKGHQVRREKLKKYDCDCQEAVQKLKERTESGVQDRGDLDEAQGLLDKANEMVFHYGEKIKIAFHDLLEDTGLANLDELLDIVGDDHELPKVDQNVFAGTPMNVIQKRSDVAIKLNILKHICGLMGITLADKFPKVIIDAVLETSAKSIFDILKVSNFSFAYGYHVEQNVFEQSKLKAKINMFRSQYEKAQSEYKQVVMKALAEVANAMTHQSIIMSQLELAAQKMEMIERKLENVKAKVEMSAAHITQHLQVEHEKYMQEDEKIKLESGAITGTMDLVHALGG